MQDYPTTGLESQTAGVLADGIPRALSASRYCPPRHYPLANTVSWTLSAKQILSPLADSTAPFKDSKLVR